MLFMKEQRPKVIAECTLRESSAINQILGRRVSEMPVGGVSTSSTQKKVFIYFVFLLYIFFVVLTLF